MKAEKHRSIIDRDGGHEYLIPERVITKIEDKAKLEALEELKEDWNREPFRISPYYDRLNKRIEELKLTNVRSSQQVVSKAGGQDG